MQKLSHGLSEMLASVWFHMHNNVHHTVIRGSQQEGQSPGSIFVPLEMFCLVWTWATQRLRAGTELPAALPFVHRFQTLTQCPLTLVLVTHHYSFNSIHIQLVELRATRKYPDLTSPGLQKKTHACIDKENISCEVGADRRFLRNIKYHASRHQPLVPC